MEMRTPNGAEVLKIKIIAAIVREILGDERPILTLETEGMEDKDTSIPPIEERGIEDLIDLPVQGLHTARL
jgi:hypothetical protein